MNLEMQQTDSGIIFTAKIVPGSSRSRIAGLMGGVVKINIAAAAEKGKANKQLIEFLSKLMNQPKSSITIHTGTHKTRKRIHIAEMTGRRLIEHLKPYI